MKKASLVIQDIQNNVYNDMLLDVYMDLQQLEYQKQDIFKLLKNL